MMKGLIRLPTMSDLSETYGKLQSTRDPISEDQLALWSQWARLDPRLAEQWIAHLLRFWKKISVVTLRERLLDQPWPAAAGVLLSLASDAIAERDERKILQRWTALVMEGVRPASNEIFFIGTRAFAGKLMREDAFHASKCYQKWGYLGRDRLIAKESIPRQKRTLLRSESRRKILDDLLSERSRITVKEYRLALNDEITPRVAELDLKNHPLLIAHGNTRGRFYRIKPSKRRE